MRATLLLVTLLVGTTLAGCLDGTDPAATDPEAELTQTTGFALDTATLPTGQNARDQIQDYVMSHPYRLNSPATQGFMDTARDDLEALVTGFGIPVERHTYATGVNLLGIHNGTTEPEKWIVLSAHYDTTETTVYGAWDDGAGTAALIELARAMADWDYPYTVVFAFFDEEEQGLIGSAAFVRDYGARDDIELVANLNMDPPGLNWPCGDATGDFPVKIIENTDRIESTHPRSVWLHEALTYGLDTTEVPLNVRDRTPGIPIATALGQGLTGTSDHHNFDVADIANAFLGGVPATRANPDEEGGGTVAALTYPLHTPLDTLEQMEARCTGGTGTLADGLHTIVMTVAHALDHMADAGDPGR